jgi:hypothetical protein
MPSTQSVFDSIATHDKFNVFTGAKPNYNKVREVLRFDKGDIAKAAHVTRASVRFDKRAPREILERMTEWAAAISLVGQFFDDFDKVVIWFHVANPLLGGVTPRDMILLGRSKRLLKFIQNALDENKK